MVGFLVVFLFPRSRWGFRRIIHIHLHALNYTFLLWLSRVNCGEAKHTNAESLLCVHYRWCTGEILLSKDSSPTHLMNIVASYYLLQEKVEIDVSLRTSA